MTKVGNEEPPRYSVGAMQRNGTQFTDAELQTLSDVADIYARKLRSRGASMCNPRDSADFIKAKLYKYPHEVFACLFLDNRHRVIEWVEMFRGTVDGASVHPREVVREALGLNACAVIFAHNHPSGVAEPSAADRAITHELRDALQMVAVRVLDHIIVGDGEPTSMAARGLL